MSEASEFHEEDKIGKVYDWGLLRRLLHYVRPHVWAAWTALGMMILASLLQLVGPLATLVALDLYVRPFADENTSPLSRWVDQCLQQWGLALEPMDGIMLMSGIFLASLILTFGVLFAQGYVLQVMGQNIMYDMRREVFAKLQRLPIAFFNRNPIGRLVTRATNDVEALNELFTSGFVPILGDFLLLVGIVVVLFLMNWKLALVSFAILPLLLLTSIWFRSRVRQSFREIRVKLARINAFLQEHLTGMSVVQLFRREDRAFAEFSAVNALHRDANVHSIFYYAVFFPAVGAITALGLALIVWFGGGQILRHELSLGALIAFLQYDQRFFQPIVDLSEKYNILQGAMASAERLFQLLDTEVEITSPPNAWSAHEVKGAITFDRVSFSYSPEEPVLEDVSFQVAPGETVAVVGHTGAGKSTLTNLLLRFYDVNSGNVRIDGVDVRQWDLQVLRRQIAMVLQDVFLFSGDIASNIRLGNEISDETLRWATHEVGAWDFIERLPGGLAATVRERGAGLSVGQKQLIAFARALAADPRILILDEATASIDTETEQRIQKALERLLIGRTSLVIAHRLSTIQRADRILVMHKGRLREQGTHQELLAARGIYHKLYLLQYQEEVPKLTGLSHA